METWNEAGCFAASFDEVCESGKSLTSEVQRTGTNQPRRDMQEQFLFNWEMSNFFFLVVVAAFLLAFAHCGGFSQESVQYNTTRIARRGDPM